MFLCNNITSIQYKVHVIKSSEIGIYQLKTNSESCPSWRGTRDFFKGKISEGVLMPCKQQIFARIELLRLRSKLWIHLLKRRSFCNQSTYSIEKSPEFTCTELYAPYIHVNIAVDPITHVHLSTPQFCSKLQSGGLSLCFFYSSVTSWQLLFARGALELGFCRKKVWVNL